MFLNSKFSHGLLTMFFNKVVIPSQGLYEDLQEFGFFSQKIGR